MKKNKSLILFIFSLSLVCCSSNLDKKTSKIPSHLSLNNNFKQLDDVPKFLDLEKLTKGGSGSKVYKVEIKNKHLAWKKVKVGECDFKEEIKGMEKLSEYNLGARIIYVNHQNGFYIYEFLEDQPISIQERKSKELYLGLSDVLKKLHSIPKKNFDKRTPYEIFRNNLQRAYKHSNLTKNTRQALHKVSKIVDTIKINLIFDESITHNDLIPFNMIYKDKKFKLIDPIMFVGNKYFDLATISLFWCFWPKAEQILYRSYFERKLTKEEVVKMNNMKNMVRAVYLARTINDCPENYEFDINETIKVGFLPFLRDTDLDDNKDKKIFASILYKDILKNYLNSTRSKL